MKEITQSFMKVLMCTNLSEENIKAITALFWMKPQHMDELVAYIKENPDATESELLKKATEIAK